MISMWKTPPSYSVPSGPLMLPCQTKRLSSRGSAVTPTVGMVLFLISSMSFNNLLVEKLSAVLLASVRKAALPVVLPAFIVDADETTNKILKRFYTCFFLGFGCESANSNQVARNSRVKKCYYKLIYKFVDYLPKRCFFKTLFIRKIIRYLSNKLLKWITRGNMQREPEKCC